MEETFRKREFTDAIRRARACSPFLTFLLDSLPESAAALAAGDLDAAVVMAQDAGAAEDVMTAVRRERSALALALGIGDLAGALSLEEVVRPLSDLADCQLERALAAAFAERTPGLVFLKVDRAWDPIREHPKFRQLVAQIGFPG